MCVCVLNSALHSVACRGILLEKERTSWCVTESDSMSKEHEKVTEGFVIRVWFSYPCDVTNCIDNKRRCCR